MEVFGMSEEALTYSVEDPQTGRGTDLQIASMEDIPMVVREVQPEKEAGHRPNGCGPA